MKRGIKKAPPLSEAERTIQQLREIEKFCNSTLLVKVAALITSKEQNEPTTQHRYMKSIWH